MGRSGLSLGFTGSRMLQLEADAVETVGGCCNVVAGVCIRSWPVVVSKVNGSGAGNTGSVLSLARVV